MSTEPITDQLNGGSGVLMQGRRRVGGQAALSVSPLGRALRRLRADHGLTQREVAEAAEISQASISRVEDGRVMSMRGENLARVAAVFGVSADYLMSGAQGSAMSADVTTLRRDLAEARLQLAAYGIGSWLDLVDMARRFGQHASERFSIQPLANMLICGGTNFASVTTYGQALGKQFTGEALAEGHACFESARDSWRTQRVRTAKATVPVSGWLPLDQEPVLDEGVDPHIVDMPFSQGILRFLVDGHEAASTLTQGALIFAPIAELAVKSVTALAREQGERAEVQGRMGLLEELLDAVPAPVFVTDRDGRVILANRHLTASEQSRPTEGMIEDWLTTTTDQPMYELLGALPQGGSYLAVVRHYGPAPLRFRVRHVAAQDGELAYLHTGFGGAEAAAEASTSLAQAQGELAAVVHDLVRLSCVLGREDLDQIPEAGTDMSEALRTALAVSRLSDKSRRMVELLIEGAEDDSAGRDG
jgi:transcriptional regulator with XRE-family HTH domain